MVNQALLVEKIYPDSKGKHIDEIKIPKDLEKIVNRIETVERFNPPQSLGHVRWRTRRPRGLKAAWSAGVTPAAHFTDYRRDY